MPYIAADRRPELDKHLEQVIKACCEDQIKAAAALASIATVSSSTLIVPGVTFLVQELNDRINAGQDVAGDINYCMSRLLYEMLNFKQPSYHKSILRAESLLCAAEEMIRLSRAANKIIAMATLRLVGREIYRRFSAPYEDQAIQKNGDIT